jgi:phosphohistidine phosphatase
MGARRTLYLVRHAIAEERGPRWPDDRLRPLSAEGAARMRRAVRGLEALDEPIEVILTSPLTRAVQTAEILARGLAARPDVVRIDALAPGTPPARLARALAAHGKPEAMALVGHEPDLGQLAAWLIGAASPLEFRKGGACRIETTDWPPGRDSRLVWFATPKMLRKLK